jgi:pyridoxamine 5'-phosphate oxidase
MDEEQSVHVSLEDMRESYRQAQLDQSLVSPNPILQFAAWFSDAQRAEIYEPNAMTLATCDQEGRPSARVVLLKKFGDEGFTFYTNYDSRKARDIERNPATALVFYWPDLERQVRVEGQAVRTSPEQSAGYFQRRPRGSQLGALASRQSAVVASRTILEGRLAELEGQYRETEVVPAPPFWGGYRITPHAIEFWQGRPNRLHDRLRYRRIADEWILERLEP